MTVIVSVGVIGSGNQITNCPGVLVSWQDAGSGVLVFVAVALLLGLIVDRDQPAGRVIGMAATAGITALIVDIFVL